MKRGSVDQQPRKKRESAELWQEAAQVHRRIKAVNAFRAPEEQIKRHWFVALFLGKPKKQARGSVALGTLDGVVEYRRASALGAVPTKGHGAGGKPPAPARPKGSTSVPVKVGNVKPKASAEATL